MLGIWATGSVAAYGPNIIAAVEVILGTYAAQGKLPVNIPVLDMETRTYTDELAYERGYGLTYAAKAPEHHSWTGLECEHCGATRENPFSDIPESAYYFNAALWAIKASPRQASSISWLSCSSRWAAAICS